MHPTTPALDLARDQDLDRVRGCLERAGRRAEDAVGAAVASLATWKLTLAVAVESARDEVAVLEDECDEICVHALVRGRLAGREQLAVITALKGVRDVARVAELAVNVTRRAGTLRTRPLPAEVTALAEAARRELGAALAAVRDDDAVRAGLLDVRVSASDDWNRAALRRLHELGREPAHDADELVALSSVCGYLERIGDHAIALARRVRHAEERLVEQASADDTVYA